ncbi:Retrovirus-related Pol polyprotein like [Argiope bruennichi]|uniref:RNA-directed DNA polymerase n=1 Tax=Argiope bruennichi TaxID=94029 RepID=A0A8T0EIY2_ARGBR|nr:Retrovirus-related Pol polyprotein like [Argiope bruennichi]
MRFKFWRILHRFVLGEITVQVPPIQSEVAYLGHIISAEGVRTDPDKISAVRHWTCPTDVHQLRSFLGLCTYYRKFVKNFSTIARPLHKLTEAKQKFIWTDECDNAFNKLKDALTSAPVLAYPEIGKQFILDTDASHECIGAVLSQEIDGQERVIAYFRLGQETALFLLAYRSAVHETTGLFPSQMLFGRDLRLPADLLFSRPPDAPLVPEEYVENLRTRMEEVHHLARDRIGMASEKVKTQYDATATGYNFHEGDQVWLWNPKSHKGLSPKYRSTEFSFLKFHRIVNSFSNGNGVTSAWYGLGSDPAKSEELFLTFLKNRCFAACSPINSFLSSEMCQQMAV